ncbi:MAG: hypothetical protein ABR981_01035 [Candidatus Micrarchaeaceae archaeon]|jgi:hypothetical protein
MDNYVKLILAVVLVAILAVAIVNSSGKGVLSSIRNPSFTSSNNASTIVITPEGIGYNVSNITLIKQFIITMNGSIFKLYVAHILSPSTAAIGLNGSIYSLTLNKPFPVRKVGRTTFYAKLTDSAYLANPQTVNIYFYPVTQPIPPILNSTYNLTKYVPLIFNISNTGASINITSYALGSVNLVVTNITNSTTAPQNYNPILVLSLNTSSNVNITESLTIKYHCFLSPGELALYELGANGAWIPINAFTVNATGCSESTNIPQKLAVVGLFQNQQGVPTINSTSVTTLPTTIASSVSTTIPQSGLTISSSELDVSGIIILIIILIAAYYLLSKGKKGKDKEENGTKKQDQKQAQKQNQNKTNQ